tara:strand:+ start:1081 stop:1230 length:150 start_codon:yes stop_codon:yes gene_type:complete
MEVEPAVTEAEVMGVVLAVAWEAGAAMEEHLVMEAQVAVAGTAAAVQVR